eukprot:TRINITY_DN5035_c0_g1_i3.p1 TRINITY_DN5035_c0_g1~~TRINITY_DN5035_c0_g1_i3.p1  ORF type:complete len:487 (+),score=125.90 TRINITY_DN5035_c0_g1_i3:1099-2559(+)
MKNDPKPTNLEPLQIIQGSCKQSSNLPFQPNMKPQLGLVIIVACVLVLAHSVPDACIEGLDESRIFSDFKLSCPEGSYITNITFASYGQPSGTCKDDNFQTTVCTLDRSGPQKLKETQAKVDQNVHWLLNTVCYARSSCDATDISLTKKNFTADVLFGDPCQLVSKYLSVRATCGARPAPQPIPSEVLWSSSQDLTFSNFNMTKNVLAVTYDIVESDDPLDAILENYMNAQLIIDPIEGKAPFRFMPLITFEELFHLKYFGWTTAWFGIVSRIPIPGFVVVVFRGTLSPTEWIYDADLLSVPLPAEMGGAKYPQARVHQGFLQLYLGLRSMIIDGMDSYEPKGIIITGHSLGSSLATLAAFDLAINGYNVHSVYTYASPRVGDPYFVEAFEGVLKSSSSPFSSVPRAPHYRIANSADLVTQVPPAALSDPDIISKYMHVSGVGCTFEYVDPSVVNYTLTQYTSWAHNMNTYFKFAPHFLPLDTTSQ